MAPLSTKNYKFQKIPEKPFVNQAELNNGFFFSNTKQMKGCRIVKKNC